MLKDRTHVLAATALAVAATTMSLAAEPASSTAATGPAGSPELAAVPMADPGSTPSARLVAELKESGASFLEYSLALSRKHAETLRAQPLPPEVAAAYRRAAQASLQEQRRIEQSDTEDFDTYVARYHAALKAPGSK